MISSFRAMQDEFILSSFDQLSTCELYEILRAHADVFTAEEHILYPDADGQDYDCLHVFSMDTNGTVTSYLRMLRKNDEDAVIQLGRVLTRVHRTGLGTRLLKASMNAAATYLDAQELYIESQKHAVGFYRKAGFDVTSGDFMEAGIVHVQMRKHL